MFFAIKTLEWHDKGTHTRCCPRSPPLPSSSARFLRYAGQFIEEVAAWYAEPVWSLPPIEARRRAIEDYAMRCLFVIECVPHRRQAFLPADAPHITHTHALCLPAALGRIHLSSLLSSRTSCISRFQQDREERQSLERIPSREATTDVKCLWFHFSLSGTAVGGGCGGRPVLSQLSDLLADSVRSLYSLDGWNDRQREQNILKHFLVAFKQLT